MKQYKTDIYIKSVEMFVVLLAVLTAFIIAYGCLAN